jgi:predicted nucleic acid-binding protein
MNGYLLDTNVVSALRRPKQFPQIVAWLGSVPPESLRISVVTMGEIRHGIERKLRTDLEQGRALEQWYRGLLPFYGERILPVDLTVAEQWGELGIQQPTSTADGLIAATALTYDLTLATRNTSDFTPHGVRVIDPFMG